MWREPGNGETKLYTIPMFEFAALGVQHKLFPQSNYIFNVIIILLHIMHIHSLISKLCYLLKHNKGSDILFYKPDASLIRLKYLHIYAFIDLRISKLNFLTFHFINLRII